MGKWELAMLIVAGIFVVLSITADVTMEIMAPCKENVQSLLPVYNGSGITFIPTYTCIRR